MDDLLLQEAIAAIKAGYKEHGQQLLLDVLSTDPQNEKALFWMTAVTEDPYHRRHYLRQVLAVNPQNKKAQRGLARLANLPERPEASDYRERERPLLNPQPIHAPAEIPPPPAPSTGQEPWNKTEWRTGVIKPHNAIDSLFLGLFGAFWMVAGLIAYEPYGTIPTWEFVVRIAVFFFGLALVIVALQRAQRTLTFANSRFRMDHIPGVIGGEVTGTLHIAGHISSERPLIVRLLNIEKTISRISYDSAPITSHLYLYESVHTFNTSELQKEGNQTIVPLTFTIPYNKTKDETANAGDTSYRWSLQVKCDLPGTNLDLDFTLPIFRTPDSDPSILNSGEPMRTATELDAYLAGRAEQRCISMVQDGDGVKFTAVPRPPLSYAIIVTFLAILFPLMIPIMINSALTMYRYSSADSIFTLTMSTIFIVVPICFLPLPFLFSWIMIKQFLSMLGRRQIWIMPDEIHHRTTIFGLYWDKHIPRKGLRMASKSNPGSRNGRPYYKVTLNYYDGEKKPENARVAILANEVDTEAEAAWFIGTLRQILPELR